MEGADVVEESAYKPITEVGLVASELKCPWTNYIARMKTKYKLK
jgi:hypothetical protein